MTSIIIYNIPFIIYNDEFSSWLYIITAQICRIMMGNTIGLLPGIVPCRLLEQVSNIFLMPANDKTSSLTPYTLIHSLSIIITCIYTNIDDYCCNNTTSLQIKIPMPTLKSCILLCLFYYPNTSHSQLSVCPLKFRDQCIGHGIWEDKQTVKGEKCLDNKEDKGECRISGLA